MKNWINKSFCCALTAALGIVSETGARAQIGGVPLWTKYHSNAELVDLAADNAGNVFLSGAPFQTVKYSGTGELLWTRRHLGPPDLLFAAPANALDGSGNVFVTGFSISDGSVTLKYSGAGVPLWTNFLNATVTRAIAVDGSGNVFVGGSTTDYVTAAYSNSGVPLWTNYYNGPGNSLDELRAVAVDGSGNVVVIGSSAGSGWATIKYSGAGVPLWTNLFAGAQYANAVAVDASGNVFVAGGPEDCTTIKYSAAGVPLWTNTYPGPAIGFTSAGAAALDSSGNLYVGGSTIDNVSNNANFVTLKYSGTGVPLWTNVYTWPNNLSNSAWVGSVVVDGSGNVYAQGGAAREGDPSVYLSSSTTIAYSSEGALLWTNVLYALPYESLVPAALALDNSGNVFAGTLRYYGDNVDSVLIKYSSALLPSLTIARTTTNTMAVTWPSPSTGFTLQQNSDIKNPLNWTDVSAGVQDDGVRKTLIVAPATGNRFYRLKKP
jgi:hypothetical protein